MERGVVCLGRDLSIVARQLELVRRGGGVNGSMFVTVTNSARSCLFANDKSLTGGVGVKRTQI